MKGTARSEDGVPAPFIAVQPFPALLDLPVGAGAGAGAGAVKASCGSRHTAVVTSEWGWVAASGWSRKSVL